MTSTLLFALGQSAALSLDWWQDVLTDFVTLLAVVDPIGTVPLFLGIVGARPLRELNRIANRAISIAAGVLLVFLVGGPFLLGAMGIGINSFRVAGGIVLFRLAFGMIFDQPKSRKPDALETEGDPAVFPIGIPAIAGPGTILAVVVLADEHQLNLLHQLRTAGILAVVLLLQWIALRAATPLQRWMGAGGTNILSRVMGLILAALAVETVIAGLHGAGFGTSAAAAT